MSEEIKKDPQYSNHIFNVVILGKSVGITHSIAQAQEWLRASNSSVKEIRVNTAQRIR